MSRADDGFTLLEVLVAVSVLALVLAGLAEGARFGVRIADRQSAQVDANAELDGTDRVLRTLVAQMEPGTLTNAPLLTAGPAALSFTTDVAAVAPAAGIGRADVALGVTGGRLVLRWVQHLHEARLAGAAETGEATLLAGVSGVRFAYCCDGGGGWVGSWAGPTLPALVRVSLDFADRRRSWPPIVVAPVRQRPNG